MSLGHPKVTVALPVYNGAAYLRESIESVVAQTFIDFELIVCDNCSTDETPDIVRQFRDPRLTYVRNPANLGLVGNMNRCLALARGEYVCLWSHDDVMLPENLERKVGLLDLHPSVGFVHSNILLIDGAGRPIASGHWAEDSRRDYLEEGLSYCRRLLNGSNPVCEPSALARRACYERVGAYRDQLPFACDLEMWMRLSLFYDVACIGRPLLKYRFHDASLTSSFGGFRGWEQVCLAKRVFLEEYRDHIPRWAHVRRETFARLARSALAAAHAAYEEGGVAASRPYLTASLRCFPGALLKSREFWLFAAKAIVGPMGLRLYRAIARRPAKGA